MIIGLTSNLTGELQYTADLHPPEAVPFAPDGFTWVDMDEHLIRPSQPTTRIPVAVERLVAWVEVVPLADLKAAAIATTYRDVDAVYDDAIGRRATEYADAEAAARAFMQGDPEPVEVSEYITAHAIANPTGEVQTNAWAAQQIIERADAFRLAQQQLRSVRFARQADMRAAMTHAELAAAVTQWNGFISGLRAQLGL